MDINEEEKILETSYNKWKRATFEEIENTLKEQQKYSEWLNSWIQAIGKNNIQKITNKKGLILWDSSQT